MMGFLIVDDHPLFGEALGNAIRISRPDARIFEAASIIRREFYVAVLLDRAVLRPIVMASTEGGMDIEEVAARTPEKIVLEKRAGAPCAWVTVGVSEVKPLVGPELPPLELKPMSRTEFLEMLRLHPELKDILPIPKEEPAGKKQTDKRKAEPIKD